MNNKEKFELEYTVNASATLLYYRISNPAGLEEWFADRVTVNNKKFKFIWSESEQIAELLEKKSNLYAKFRWIDSEEDTYFEMRIIKQELSGDVGLLITDFASVDEKSDTEDMWDEQIQELRQTLGV